MSVELEARVRRANLISRDRHLERLYEDDLSRRLLRDIYSKKEGRMSETTDRPEPTTVEDVPPDEEAFRPAPTHPQRRSPAFVPAILTAVIAIGVIVALVARDQTPDVAATPVEIAEKFMAALNSHDADLAISLLSENPSVSDGSVEMMRSQIEQEEILGWTYHVDPCFESSETGVRCDYAFSNHLSRALGFGPYVGNFFRFTIVGGEITSVTNREASGGFQEQTLPVFFAWMEENHPEDAENLYYRYTGPEVMTRWEQYLPEFLASLEDSG